MMHARAVLVVALVIALAACQRRDGGGGGGAAGPGAGPGTLPRTGTEPDYDPARWSIPPDLLERARVVYAPGDLQAVTAWPILGNRGYALCAVNRDALAALPLPAPIRVHAGVIEAAGAFYRDVHDLEGWLTRSAP